jgi:hypothetical protein
MVRNEESIRYLAIKLTYILGGIRAISFTVAALILGGTLAFIAHTVSV